MKSLTEIIGILESLPNRTMEQQFLLLLAIHLKNLENKMEGLRAEGVAGNQ